jgi:regulator of replication initiation timing
MSEQQCGECPQLRARVRQLEQENQRLDREVEKLRIVLGNTRSELVSTVNFMDEQREKPTMPKPVMTYQVRERLVAMASRAQGR